MLWNQMQGQQVTVHSTLLRRKEKEKDLVCKDKEQTIPPNRGRQGKSLNLKQ